MTDKEVMQMALDTFNKSKRSHYYCEDRFYSCPKHEEGCADALESDECNCGADTVNKSIDAAIEALRTALAQPEKTDMQIGITYEEANPPEPYCKRCGKKLGTEAYDVHTCTPKQPEPAECDGGQCGIGGYCKQCPKTQPDVPETAFGETEPVAIKFQIYKQTPPRGRELEPINSALLPWVYDQDPSSGNTASMWVTPVATLPSKKEWVGLTEDERLEIIAVGGEAAVLYVTEAKLKDKNT